MTEGNQNNNWLWIKAKKKLRDGPSEIRIDINGNVYIDGELFDEQNPKYPGLTVDVEKHNRMNTGEETQKIIESRKTAKSGDVVKIRDVKGPDRIESTTVKF
ncbi:MAG TPA: hypothetical protein GXX36_07340 [Clostridiaceae bacterium]|nr:hypothetical protein [Clostridiaceae bacterium]